MHTTSNRLCSYIQELVHSSEQFTQIVIKCQSSIPCIYGMCRPTIYLWYVSSYHLFMVCVLLPSIYGMCPTIYLWYVSYHLFMVCVLPSIYGMCPPTMYLWYVSYSLFMVCVLLPTIYGMCPTIYNDNVFALHWPISTSCHSFEYNCFKD